MSSADGGRTFFGRGSGGISNVSFLRGDKIECVAYLSGNALQRITLFRARGCVLVFNYCHVLMRDGGRRVREKIGVLSIYSRFIVAQCGPELQWHFSVLLPPFTLEGCYAHH